MRHAVHAELVVMKPGGGTRTVTVDRGKVVSISGDEITIKRPDGVEVTRTLSPKVPKARLKPGAAVVVVSEEGTAIRVMSKKRGDKVNAE